MARNIRVSLGDTWAWTRVLTDDYSTGTVPAHWGVYTAQFGSTPNNWPAAANVTVSGGVMRLLMDFKASGAGGAGWYTAGMMDLTSGGSRPEQQVTLRWRLTGTDLVNVLPHRNLPILWPSTDQVADGEADFFEGSALTGAHSFLHYQDGVTVIDSGLLAVDVTQWHTYRFVMRDHKAVAYIDDMTNPAWFYQGTEATIPTTNRRVVLQTECKPAGCPSSALSAETATVEIASFTIDAPA